MKTTTYIELNWDDVVKAICQYANASLQGSAIRPQTMDLLGSYAIPVIRFETEAIEAEQRPRTNILTRVTPMVQPDEENLKFRIYDGAATFTEREDQGEDPVESVPNEPCGKSDDEKEKYWRMVTSCLQYFHAYKTKDAVATVTEHREALAESLGECSGKDREQQEEMIYADHPFHVACLIADNPREFSVPYQQAYKNLLCGLS